MGATVDVDTCLRFAARRGLAEHSAERLRPDAGRIAACAPRCRAGGALAGRELPEFKVDGQSVRVRGNSATTGPPSSLASQWSNRTANSCSRSTSIHLWCRGSSVGWRSKTCSSRMAEPRNPRPPASFNASQHQRVPFLPIFCVVVENHRNTASHAAEDTPRRQKELEHNGAVTRIDSKRRLKHFVTSLSYSKPYEYFASGITAPDCMLALPVPRISPAGLVCV